jgi:hypothetical protein
MKEKRETNRIEIRKARYEEKKKQWDEESRK